MHTALIFLVLALASRSSALKGDMTYYTDWRYGHGSCGLNRAMTDHFYVAALSTSYMRLPPGETNSNNHPLCKSDQCIEVTGNRGRVVLKISDTCEGCAENDIDVAETVFPMLDDPSRGRVKVSWKFVNCHSNPPGEKNWALGEL